MASAIRVLYIGCLAHSGSTILSRILGEVNGLVAAGEVYALSERITNGDHCGCGETLRACPFWSSVLSSAFPDGDALPRLRTERRWIRGRHLPAVMVGREHARLAAYRRDLGLLYGAIASVAGARVIVDSSKSPTYLHLLAGAPGVQVSLVHLVRDPRPTSYSWSIDPHFHRTRGPAFGARWTLWNLELEALAARFRPQALRIRYEDFVSRPERETRRLLTLVGASDATLPFAGEHSVRLPSHHMVEGHASRFETGTIELRPSSAWRAHLSRRRSLAAAVTASPLQLLYGYPSD